MNERTPKYTGDQRMRFVAENGGHRNPREEARLAKPQQIGEAISKAAKESDEANPDEPTLLQRLVKTPEGSLLLLGIISTGIGILSSQPGQELLRKISGQ